MKVGDIIEVIHYENGALENMRRVRLTSVTRHGSAYRVLGTNLRGKNTVEYKLPYEQGTRPDDGYAWIDAGKTIVGDI